MFNKRSNSSTSNVSSNSGFHAPVGVISTGGSTFCTGFMVNNTANDKTPYFMTAEHCKINSRTAKSLVVYWNYQASACGGRRNGGKNEFNTGSQFLAKSAKSDFKVLTDITGFEDAFGLMDFKVAGTEKGITAIQMDIKYKGGLPREVFEKSLEQARQARIHILDQMKKVMSKPKEALSDLVPQVESFKINSDKIGAVIGSGGKVIKEIIEKTGTSIDIEGDGIVRIFGQPGPEMDRAVMWVKVLAGQIKAGMEFNGIVKKVAEFGLFVELVPGKEGLVHVSAIPREKQRNMSQDYPVNSPLKIKVVEYDSELDRVRLQIVNG